MGGDHKCPLCSATFTRPQHVGRHLRAHTGDRPYECKECPLKFARSDLLSRHVNKAHRAQDGSSAQDKKPAKKGRRKSVPAAVHSTLAKSKAAESLQSHQLQTQQPQQDQQSHHQIVAHPVVPTVRERSRSESLHQQPHLQAQRMYPHHPLLAAHPSQSSLLPNSWNVNPSSSFVATAGMMTSPSYAPNLNRPAPSVNGSYGNKQTFHNQVSFEMPFTAQPMSMSGSDQEFKQMEQNHLHSSEWISKKRACDQCNSSKVKCDSGEPCLRCKQRNLSCSYRKHQRPTTLMGPPLAPGQTTSLLNTASPANLHMSPASQSSSPNFSESLIAPTEPVMYRKPSVASLPANLGNVPNPAPASSVPWGSYPQTAISSTWPPNQAQAGYTLPAGTAPGSITGQALEASPTSMNVSLPSYPSQVQRQGRISPYHMGPAQTPSLVSNIESPSEPDEPHELRGSYNSSVSSTSTGWNDKGKSVLGLHPNGTFFVQKGNSPTHGPSTQASPLQHSSQSISTFQNPDMHWQNVGTGRWHMRSSFSSDDDSTSLISSDNSKFVDVPANNPAASHANHERRRSSQSAWAKAMEQMSIEDSQKNAMAAAGYRERSGSATSATSTASRASGVPDMAPAGEAQTVQMPSLSDAKDLWRMFMAEPMNGMAPVAAGGDLENTSIFTPRPPIGKRTLSKSNSMPDLHSPMVNGPAFFSTFLNGATPKACDPQESYMPAHQAATHSSTHNGPPEQPDFNTWSREIQQRQSSFSLSSRPGAKLGKSKLQKKSTQPGSNGTSSQGSQPHFAPPLPSVVQRTSALDQTLAPERLPGFGLTPGFELSQNPHFPLQSRGASRMSGSGLANDVGKRASFSVWGEEGPIGGDLGAMHGQDQDVAMYSAGGFGIGSGQDSVHPRLSVECEH